LLLTLQPGGIREPHWHPSAWEINIVIKGVAAWVVIDGNGNHESFDQHVNDIVFAPQGSFHYFENRGPDDMTIVIIQNTSAPEDKDNIGLGESLSRLPPRCCPPSSVFPQRHSTNSRRSRTRSSSCGRRSSVAEVDLF
jgi:oxalate decarboxylase